MATTSGVIGRGGLNTPRDFKPGNFWPLIWKNGARKKGQKMGNVEENEEKWKQEGGKLGKKLKRKEENEKCTVKNDRKS